MNVINNLKKAAVAAVLIGGVGLLGAVPAAAQPLPSYAAGTTDETIHGTVASINGQYNISVRDSRGFIDSVTLHQGTIINPTGLELAPGQSVTILGSAQGNTFAANEIDTPYQNLAVVPVYPGDGYWGYPYGRWGYGPSFRLGLRFGR